MVSYKLQATMQAIFDEQMQRSESGYLQSYKEGKSCLSKAMALFVNTHINLFLFFSTQITMKKDSTFERFQEKEYQRQVPI